VLFTGGGCRLAALSAQGSGGYDAPYFQADCYQKLTDYSSALVNPALIYGVNQIHIDFGMYSWTFPNVDWGYKQVGVLYPIRMNHTVGVTAIMANASIEKRANANDDNPISLGYGDYWITANYGIKILPWLMAGTNVKFRIQHQFEEDTRIGMPPGFDLGVYFNPLDHYRYGDVGFSLNFQDIVPTTISWGSSDTTASVSSPRLRAGVRYSAFNDEVVADVEMVLDNAFGNFWREALESVKDEAAPVIPRYGAHVRYEFIPQVWLKGGWTNNNISYVGLRLNLMYPLPEAINYLAADFDFGYAFSGLLTDLGADPRGFTLMSKLSADFGPTREQRESRRLYNQLIAEPQNAYNEAMKLYVEGKYWEASFAFGKVLTLFPNFHLNDKVMYYMGNSYRFLHLNDIARDMYTEGMDKFSASQVRPKYLYGLMKIDYTEAKYESALKRHAFIVNLYPESDIRADADYLAGEIYFEQKNYESAKRMLEKIQPGDPPYLYAQYTLSIINIQEERSNAAIQNLRTIVSDTSMKRPNLLLIDAANTKMGHLYFEQVKLRQAVEAYQKVSAGSPYHEEALIGMAWSWIKVQQPKLCLQTLTPLTTNYPESPFLPEAYLLKGYANILLNRYKTAKNMLERCVELCKEDYVTERDLQRRRQQFDQTEEEFQPTAEKIKQNALTRPVAQTLEQRDRLEDDYEEFAQEEENFFDYTLKAKSHSKFLRRKEKVLEDAQYALARAEEMLATRQERETIEKQKEKEEKIDEQIKELEQQLQNGDSE
jgi:tetratricopeptide (TPR) repeat protein